ncbi:MAG: putative toxin-antitoxin system toxin component, PIN family [Terracidiphilus sp.]
MRLAVFDTNVLVSAGINPAGAPGRLVLEWVLSGQVQTLVCPWIANEYREVARREKLARYGFPPRWWEFLIATSLELPDPRPWLHSLPDPKDAPFLALAHAAGAWLVTGNLKHFPERFSGGVTVISPGEYLEGLEAP